MDALFPLSLSEPKREDEEFLLVAEEEDDKLDEEDDDDDDEEAAAEPPCKFALVTLLAALVINGHKAEPVPIQRGSPQGRVLGCLLYCVTTQNLTKDLRGPTKPQVFPSKQLR